MWIRVTSTIALAFLFYSPIGGDEPAPLLRITPTEFFSGELKRLKPHVDFSAVCFKITAHGPYRCRPDVEMWCDGERVDHPKYGLRTDKDSEEETFSWRWREARMGKQSEFSVTFGGQEQFGRSLEVPVSKQPIVKGFGPLWISKPVELKGEHDSMIVWMVGAGDGAQPDEPEEVEKYLKVAPWAMVVRFHAYKVE